MAFECRLLCVVRLSIFGRFVFLESAISIRFVWDFSEIWICGLYLSEEIWNVVTDKKFIAKFRFIPHGFLLNRTQMKISFLQYKRKADQRLAGFSYGDRVYI